MKRGFLLCIMAFVTLMIGACSKMRSYNDEFNPNSNLPNVRTFNVDADSLYAAAIRAVLLYNFRVEKEDPAARNFMAARYSPADDDKTVVLTLSINVMQSGNDKSTIYGSAVQFLEKLRVNSNYFHVPLGVISVPTPIKTGSTATNTKEKEETVDDAAFYSRLFQVVEKELTIVRNLKSEASSHNQLSSTNVVKGKAEPKDKKVHDEKLLFSSSNAKNIKYTPLSPVMP